ncbi:hypothetical protein [Mucilaginibacter antarcticus]|uniref:hypothetical protein n=1 Tax=Mucilaginibacter antarcticus TaxID=1855725 RepID=UPI003628CE33
MPTWADATISIDGVSYTTDLLAITNLQAFLLNVVKNIAKDEKSHTLAMVPFGSIFLTNVLAGIINYT